MKTTKLLFLLTVLLPVPVLAGSVDIAPVKIYMDAKNKTSAIHITNLAEDGMTLQVDPTVWRQDDRGKDVYEPTEELVVFPKIVTLEKNEKATIRIRVQQSTAQAEKTYRIFIYELPVQKPTEKSLRVTLSLAIPVFIAPAVVTNAPEIESAQVQNGALTVGVRNKGNRHLFVKTLAVKGLDSAGAEVLAKQTNGWYVLAGAARVFTVELPKQECSKADLLKVALQGEELNLEQETKLEASQCLPAAGSQKAQGEQ